MGAVDSSNCRVELSDEASGLFDKLILYTTTAIVMKPQLTMKPQLNNSAPKRRVLLSEEGSPSMTAKGEATAEIRDGELCGGGVSNNKVDGGGGGGGVKGPGFDGGGDRQGRYDGVSGGGIPGMGGGGGRGSGGGIPGMGGGGGRGSGGGLTVEGDEKESG